MMIRPHAKSFQASANDLQIDSTDIDSAKAIRVKDFMFSFLTSNNEVDVKGIATLRRTAEDTIFICTGLGALPGPLSESQYIH